MKEVLSALVKQKGHSRGAMGLAAKLQADKELLRTRVAELEAALAQARQALSLIRACSMAGSERGYLQPELWGDDLYKSHGDVAIALRAIDTALASPQREGDRPVSPPYGDQRETKTSEGGEG